MKKIILLLVAPLVLAACKDTGKERTAAEGTADHARAPKKVEPHAGLLVQPLSHEIDPNRDTVLKLGTSGTQLHIPRHAFVDKKGETVTTTVKITFKNYTNSAEMVFSGIPMTYKHAGEEFYFNSSGMFDIEGTTNGEEIDIDTTKPLTIDYFLARQNKDIAFFKYKKESKNWDRIQEINPLVHRKKKILNPDISKVDTRGMVYNLWRPRKNAYAISFGDTKGDRKTIEGLFRSTFIPPGDLLLYLSSNQKFYLSFLFKLDTTTGEIYNVLPHPRNPTKDFNNTFIQFIQDLPPCNFSYIGNSSFGYNENMYEVQVHYDKDAITLRPKNTGSDNKRSKTSTLPGTLLAPGIDAGHYYPDIIIGLNISTFGVYNCDQIYRLANKIEISAAFRDTRGKEIEDASILSLIDLNYNGAFSLDPFKPFMISSTGKNVLVLFTESGKIYVMSNEAFRGMNIKDSKDYTFTMKDMTDELTSTGKLAKYLGIDM